MADNDDGCLWLGIIGVAALGYWYFKAEEAPKVQAYAPPAIVTAAAEGSVTGATQPQPPPKPTHGYDVVEDGVYYYVAAATEDERKRGLPSGEALPFRYYGKSDGKHLLVMLDNYGNILQSASCTSPCRLIKYSDGRRLPFNPLTVIGSAFNDAQRGFLKSTKPKMRPIKEPEYWVVDPVVEAPPAEQPAPTDSQPQPADIPAN